MAGARTLQGALVPLVGPAPTNLNFVSGDYNRKTGLKGNGTSKYLNSNRKIDEDPQDSHHNSVYVTEADTGSRRHLIGANPNRITVNLNITGSPTFFSLRDSYILQGFGDQARTYFLGTWRNSDTPTTLRGRWGGATSTHTGSTTKVPASLDSYIFHVNNMSNSGSITASRMSWYSIGEGFDLALLDSRVSTLMSEINLAI